LPPEKDQNPDGSGGRRVPVRGARRFCLRFRLNFAPETGIMEITFGRAAKADPIQFGSGSREGNEGYRRRMFHDTGREDFRRRAFLPRR